MNLYTTKAVSPAGQVNKKDLKQVLKNMVVFLAPLGLVYMLQLNSVLQGGSLHFKDFVPTQATWGAIQLYCVNTITDVLRKFSNSKG